ncbi:ubiquitin fusion degradation protein 1-like protein [Plakobranchus ocellatus]|uniref:Ubiquitin fusion degradation protein 1-like protein n=1 Tax=Plakobranchus ocellatus TaxID=259542 RepID=A0AAV4BND2_9GAST|nr:ubiquitin fusion degradation protein 1-like protein [Plakobranchus ocellatus]
METDLPEDERFRPFAGQGNRLDGKKKGTESGASTSSGSAPQRRGIPNYNFKRGTISFIRSVRPVQNGNSEEDKDETFEAFSGHGQTLKKKNRK